MNISSPGGSSEQCVPQETYLNNVNLANAYVPFQKLCDTYTPLGSLTRGTAFPPLYSLKLWTTKQMGVDTDD